MKEYLDLTFELFTVVSIGGIVLVGIIATAIVMLEKKDKKVKNASKIS